MPGLHKRCARHCQCACVCVASRCRRQVYRIHSFDYEGHIVWGLTAAIMIQVAELALGRPADFEVDHPSNNSSSGEGSGGASSSQARM